MPKKPKKRGRPAIPESERKTVLSVRVHPETRKAFEALAEAQGKTPSEFAEKVLRLLSNEAVMKKVNGLPLTPRERMRVSAAMRS